MELVTIDDSDADEIRYFRDDLWMHQTARSVVHQGTFSEGYTNARAEFRFNGTGVVVYGVTTAPPGNTSAAPPSVSFSVDGIVSSPFTVNRAGETTYGQVFYDSGSLPPGEHVLQLNVTHGTHDWPFVLDYIRYVPLPDPDSGPRSSASVSPPEDTAGAMSHAQTIAVAAGIVGAIAMTIVAIILWYCLFLEKIKGPSRSRISFIHTSRRAKVDLLDHGPKRPPSALGSPDSASASKFHEWEKLRSQSYTLPTLGTEYHLHFASARGGDVESRPSSPPSSQASSFGFVTRSSTRSGTPSSAAATGLDAATPPTILSLPGMPQVPAIAYRPATPEFIFLNHPYSASARERGQQGTSATGSSKAHMEDAQTTPRKQATFHADSGRRFREGDELPADAVSVPSQRRRAATGKKAAQDKGLTVQVGPGLHVVNGDGTRKSYVTVASAMSDVPPIYTEE